jgi:hypothetical protein
MDAVVISCVPDHSFTFALLMGICGHYQDYHFHMVGGVGLMFLDIRGSRTFHRVKDDERKYLGTHQWKSITKALDGDGIFSEARALLVCSPAPLVFLEPRITQSAAAAIPRLEDFKGHWSYKEHVKEQLLFIESLTKWKSSGSGRDILVLGGEASELIFSVCWCLIRKGTLVESI